MNAFQEIERQERRRREELGRRIRRGRRVVFIVWAVIGSMGLFSGDPDSIVSGLVLILIGGTGAVLTHRRIVREATGEEAGAGSDNHGP